MIIGKNMSRYEVLGLKIREFCYSVCIIGYHPESNQYFAVEETLEQRAYSSDFDFASLLLVFLPNRESYQRFTIGMLGLYY